MASASFVEIISHFAGHLRIFPDIVRYAVGYRYEPTAIRSAIGNRTQKAREGAAS